MLRQSEMKKMSGVREEQASDLLQVRFSKVGGRVHLKYPPNGSWGD
jgi:hypothetical protein